MSKIVGRVNNCGECPNRVYYSGNVYRCRLVDENVLNKDVVAPFCPLPDYPSRVIAEMEITILGLREQHKYGLNFALLTHIATKLKLNIHTSGRGVTIPFKDGKKARTVYLGLDYVTCLDLHSSEITFRAGDGTFKLSLNSESPLLQEEMEDRPGYWQHHTIG